MSNLDMSEAIKLLANEKNISVDALLQVLVEALLHLDRFDEAAAHLDTLGTLAPDDPATVQLRGTLARLRPAAGASPPAR